MLVAGSIMDLNLNSFPLDVLGATVNIKNSWLVSIGKRVLQIVCDEGGLTDLGVPDEHHLEMLHAIRSNNLLHCLLFWNLLLLWLHRCRWLHRRHWLRRRRLLLLHHHCLLLHHWLLLHHHCLLHHHWLCRTWRGRLSLVFFALRFLFFVFCSYLFQVSFIPFRQGCLLSRFFSSHDGFFTLINYL